MSAPISFFNAAPPALSASKLTKVGVMMPLSPLSARIALDANSAPAYAIESVADPAPFFALTTSSPPYWILFTNAGISAVAGRGCDACDSKGTIYDRQIISSTIHSFAHYLLTVTPL